MSVKLSFPKYEMVFTASIPTDNAKMSLRFDGGKNHITVVVSKLRF